MLERLKYSNHQNEVIDFGTMGIYVNTSELRNYEWSAVVRNNKITGFERGVTKRSLPVVIICEDEASGIAARNRLYEVTERDVLARQPGKIIVGAYYYRCFIVKSQKSDYLRTKRMMVDTLTTLSDNPYWVRESVYSFAPDPGGGSGYLDHPYDYPFDYSNRSASNELNNSGFSNSKFQIHIFGAVSNPSVSIGGHIYGVNCTVEEGDYLTIDSLEKKIYLTASDGRQANVFAYRLRQSYVFEPIKPGVNTVAWDGSFTFDVTLLEERSEPKWT